MQMFSFSRHERQVTADQSLWTLALGQHFRLCQR